MVEIEESAISLLTASLLTELVAWVQRWVVITGEQAVVLAAWTMHTYVPTAFRFTPYIAISGPTASCGKTLLMDVLQLVAHNPMTASGISPAALIRSIDKFAPTVFLDEMDSAMAANSESAETVRGILNAGFRQGGFFVKCVGADFEPRRFNVFGPKCFAGIGKLSATVQSRSITIMMRRALRSERRETFRESTALAQAATVIERLRDWASRVNLMATPCAEELPGISARQQDIIDPLLAIGLVAGAAWDAKLRRSLLVLFGTADHDEASLGEVLLADLQGIFRRSDAAQLSTTHLIDTLKQLEGQPWGNFSDRRSISVHDLARLLKPFAIFPRAIRVGRRTLRGYHMDDFADAFARYCTPAASSAETLQQAAPTLTNSNTDWLHGAPPKAEAGSLLYPHGQRLVADVAGRSVEAEETERGCQHVNVSNKSTLSDIEWMV